MSVEAFSDVRAPLRKSIVVAGGQSAAFARFIERIGSWWPLDKGHSVFGDSSAGCFADPGLGGEIYEASKSGARAVWGTFQVWEPPHRVAFSWHPGRTPDTAQTVEVTLTAVAEGVRIDLEHRDWHRYGADAAKAEQSYDKGWDFVLGAFGAHFAAGQASRQSWYHQVQGRVAHVRIDIKASVERVFDLIATAQGMDQWLTTSTQLDPHPGGRLAFRWDDAAGAVAEYFGRVQAWDRPHRFVFAWEADIGPYDLVCAITLGPTDGGVRLLLREEGFKDDPAGLQDLLNRQSGWAQELMRLKVFAEHGVRV